MAHIKTKDGWKEIPVKNVVPASDSPEYKGDHGATLNLHDPWADKLNREAAKGRK